VAAPWLWAWGGFAPPAAPGPSLPTQVRGGFRTAWPFGSGWWPQWWHQ